jgi:hypothetical protein
MMGNPGPRTAKASRKGRFAYSARAELNRRGISDMDIDIQLLLRRQRAKRAARKATQNIKA